jgi:hypothetical protein
VYRVWNDCSGPLFPRSERDRAAFPAHEASTLHAKSNRKDRNAMPATGPGMTGHIATIPKDRNHSLNSGTPASPCSSSTRSTDAMPLQYRPRCHRIRPLEASGLLPRQRSPTHQHLVTLYLLEAIKGACRDHSRGHDQEESITRSYDHTTLLDLARTPAEPHSHALHPHPETWEPLPLSLSLVTPTTGTSVQDNTDLPSLTGRRAFFGPN